MIKIFKAVTEVVVARLGGQHCLILKGVLFVGFDSSCDSCVYLVFDEECETYCCEAAFDEDEYARYMQGKSENCPYFQPNDEYKIVRRQN